MLTQLFQIINAIFILSRKTITDDSQMGPQEKRPIACHDAFHDVKCIDVNVYIYTLSFLNLPIERNNFQFANMCNRRYFLRTSEKNIRPLETFRGKKSCVYIRL